MESVHPRGRGEHLIHSRTQPTNVGSSPRARGTPPEITIEHVASRFIPAGAGNTKKNSSSAGHHSVHPRGRGEHRYTTEIHVGQGGSSPRARGTLCSQTYQALTGRFIPAGAGNTIPRATTAGGASVHPRGRGEHERTEWHRVVLFGSSPRARGTRLHARQTRLIQRFIPAGAGNTLRPDRRSAKRAVHPRGRGEHSVSPGPARRPSGSSPRARGTPRAQPQHARERRFIPAGAGNTTAIASCAHGSAVHPRGRGEHLDIPKKLNGSNGSSPRARGTPGAGRAAPGLRRFIPAGAGNTNARTAARADKAVHPRGRGEHT